MRLNFLGSSKSSQLDSSKLPRREVERVRGWLAATPDRFDYAAETGALSMAIGPDRRSDSRQDMSHSGVVASVRIITAGSYGNHFGGRLRDISPEGLSLLLAEPVEPGEAVSIAIAPVLQKPGIEDEPVFLRCTSIWCRPDRATGAFAIGFAVGVEFSDSLADLVTPRDMIQRAA